MAGWKLSDVWAPGWWTPYQCELDVAQAKRSLCVKCSIPNKTKLIFLGPVKETLFSLASNSTSNFVVQL